VLDFGIAKALDVRQASGPAALTTPAMTEAGIVLGTAAYMSPEQARGKAIDQRTDIWAFGCVLYEMLTGQIAFGGEDVTIVLARVLERPADLSLLPKSTPPAVRRTLELCFEKDPRQRIAHIRDARLALAGRFESEAATAVRAGERGSWRRTLPRISAAAVAGAAAVGLATWTQWPAPPLRPVVRFVHELPAGQSLGNLNNRSVVTVSPDGQQLAYVTEQGLHVRRLADLEAALLPATAGARSPAFSSDGTLIAYREARANSSRLVRIGVAGGASVAVADVVNDGLSLRWQRDGSIVFDNRDVGLLTVPGTGGTPRSLVESRDREVLFGGTLLPDGDSVLFTSAATVGSDWDDARIVVQSLATGERTVLVERGTDARYVPTGHLLYAVGDTLFGVAFDVETLTVRGGAVPLVPELLRGARSDQGAAANYDVGADGTLVYLTGRAEGAARTLVWVDRAGREEPIGAPPRAYIYAALSPDSNRLALDIRDQENDIWIFDLAREALQRLTFEPGLNRYPVWAPDGRRVAFSGRFGGASEQIYWQAWDGTGSPEALTRDLATEFVSDFTPDGAAVLAHNRFPPRDVWVAPVARGQASIATPLVQTAANEQNGTVSPDGRWLAYESNESGQSEIYVRPFPNVDSGRWLVSNGGGTRPHWTRGGRELVYLTSAPNGTVTVSALSIDAGTTFAPGTPSTLFTGAYVTPQAGRMVFDVSRDGERFVMIKDVGSGETGPSPQIVVVQNWVEELKRLVPTQ